MQSVERCSTPISPWTAWSGLSEGEWTVVDPFPYGIHGNPLVEIGGSLYLPGGSTQAAGVENDGRTFRYQPD